MLKKYMAAVLVIAFLFQPLPAFADRGRPGGFHEGAFRGDFHHPVVHRLPPGYISLMVAGMTLLFCEGLFYQYSPAGYVIVQPPVGAIIPAMPAGYTTVFVEGRPYYYYGSTYYTPAPNGYVVATPPAAVTIAPPVAAPVAVAPSPAPVVAQPAAPAPATPAVASAKKEEDKNLNVYDIYIPNGNGSYTVVTLKKTEKGFLGPQGEFYQDHPTVEQLRERYAKK